MPVQHHKKSFSVGSNDKPAATKYRARYAHSTGKCGGESAGCFICIEEADEEDSKIDDKCLKCGQNDMLLPNGTCVVCDY